MEIRWMWRLGGGGGAGWEGVGTTPPDDGDT